MSRPLAEPPAKRQRARDEGGESTDGSGAVDEEQEFQRLERVSAVQDELNVLSEEEAHQVRSAAAVATAVLACAGADAHVGALVQPSLPLLLQ